MIVIKLGGSAGIDTETFLDDLATRRESVILVHGANTELDALSLKLGIEPQFVFSPDGQVSRFTDAQTMDLFLMVYAGKVNKRITEGLIRRGRKAIGLSGIDGGLVTGRRKDAIRIVEKGKSMVRRGDFAGTIEHINSGLLTALLDCGLLPVVCPPAISSSGDAINVDGDKLAMEIATAMAADKLMIFSNTSGLLRDVADTASLVTEATRDQLPDLLKSAQGRMKKKVMSCASALDRGVAEVILGDARISDPIGTALAGGGTHLKPEHGGEHPTAEAP